jgi:hypothetical protein
MSALGDALSGLAAAFDARGTRWYVFGAQAVAVHGAPRATQDIDVTVEVRPGELDGLLSVLVTHGFVHRFPDQAEELLAAGAVVPLTHRSGMDVDLVIAGSGLEEIAMGRAERVLVAGTRVPVAHPTDLVVMKILAGRGKDMDDVEGLLDGGRVDLDEVRDLLGQLEEALGQSDLLARLDSVLPD